LPTATTHGHTITFSSLYRVYLSFSGGLIYKNHPRGELKKASVLNTKIMAIDKIRGLETAHLRIAPPFSCIFLDGNNFRSFFNLRKVDEEFNISSFIIFRAFTNYL